MGKEQVRAYLDSIGRADLQILEYGVSSATVELAARAAGVPPGQIAKTLALKVKDQVIIVVLGGEARLSNKKLKQYFGGRHRMLSAEETLDITGHAVGGVCPFGLKNPLPVYLDESLKRFPVTYPAGGESNNALPLPVAELADVTGGQWADLSE